MRTSGHHSRSICAGAVIGAALSIATAGAAAEICVTCTEPDASYKCEVEGLSAQSAAGTQGQILCIKILAGESGHKTCSVNRNTPAPCSGPLRVVRAPDSAAVAPNAATNPQMPAAVRPVPLPEPTGQPSMGPLEVAGKGIADAAKKSWSCVSSLFKDC